MLRPRPINQSLALNIRGLLKSTSIEEVSSMLGLNLAPSKLGSTIIDENLDRAVGFGCKAGLFNPPIRALLSLKKKNFFTKDPFHVNIR